MPQLIPIAAAKLIAGYFTLVTGISATVAGVQAALFYGLTAGASIAYSSAQSAKLRRQLNTSSIDQGRAIMTRDPIAPRRLIYGQVLVSGTLVFIHTTGANNQSLHLILAMAGHEVEELGDIYFGDEVVPLDGSGDATGFYAGFVHVGKHLGTSTQNVEASLNADAPTVWTTDHRLRGIAYLYIRLNYSAEKFPNGLPNVRCMVKGKKVYDPRTASTVWSANSALCAADYLMDTWFGKGVALGRIPAAAWIEAANICDEDIVLNPSGTEKRYTTNGTIGADQDPSDVLRDLAGAMAGHIVDTGGTWTIRAGAHRTPTLSLTDADLCGGFTVQPRQSRRDTFNRVRGVYISPTTNWAAADFPPISNATYKAADGGLWLDRDVQFNFTTSPATAQRLAKIELERGRQQITAGGVYMLKAMQCMPGDVVEITRASLGWTAKQFSVVSWDFRLVGEGDNLTLGIALELQETAAGVWDWNDGEETTVDLAPNTTLPDPFTVASPTSLSATSDATTTDLQSDGAVIPRVRLDWTAPADINVTQGGLIRVEYKPAATSDWRPWSTVRGDTVQEFIDTVVIGVAYNFRIRSENNLSVPGSWVTVNKTAAGDTSGPATVGTLTAVTGTGKAVSLDWPDNTELDLGEYEVQRSPAGAGTWAKLAEVRASRFVDTEVTIGTAYDYRVRAIDRSENTGPFSNTATATPGTITAGTVDTTPPSDPSPPTFSSSGTYLSGDGTVFSRLVINVPIFSTGCAVLNVLYRKTGVPGWIIADQRSTGGGTSSIDDLTPGVSYDVAVQAFSAFGVGGNIVDATGSPFAAPNNSSAAADPTGFAAHTPSSTYPVPPQFWPGGINQKAATTITFTKSTSKDLDYYEFSGNVSSVTPPSSATREVDRGQSSFVIYGLAGSLSSYLWCRTINKSGVAGSWFYTGIDLSLTLLVPAALGDIAGQSAAAVAITGGTASGLSSLSSSVIASANIKTGDLGAGSVREVLAVYHETIVVSLSGGSPTESFNVDLSGRGFGAKPDTGQAQCASDPNLIAAYDFDAGGNSSTNAVIRVATVDGSNIGGGAYRFSVALFEYN